MVPILTGNGPYDDEPSGDGVADHTANESVIRVEIKIPPDHVLGRHLDVSAGHLVTARINVA